MTTQTRFAFAPIACLTLLCSLAPVHLAQAADPALEARVARLERMLNDQALSDLVLQLQQLQQEVQDLRGQVEILQYSARQSGSDTPFGAAPRFGAPPGSGAAPDSRPESRQGGRSGLDLGSSGIPGSESPSWMQPATETGRVGPPGQASSTDNAAGRIPGSGLLGLPSPETSAGGERDLYLGAFELLKGRDYPGAREAFGDLVSRYPQGQYADNARYWLGEIGYVTQDYSAALAQFNRLITDYPLSPKVPGAMLKVGYVYYEQDDLQQARGVLEEVVTRFPDTSEASLAKGRLERMQREGG